jgi:hypothetical protein
MTTIYDHRNPTAPVEYRNAPGDECVFVPGIGSVPVASPPAELGIYPAGPDDAVPEGERVLSVSRVVRDGRSVTVYATAKPSAEVLEAEAAAAKEAEAKQPTTAEEHADVLKRLEVIEKRLEAAGIK